MRRLMKLLMNNVKKIYKKSVVGRLFIKLRLYLLMLLNVKMLSIFRTLYTLKANVFDTVLLTFWATSCFNRIFP